MYTSLLQQSESRDYLVELVEDGKIILKYILKMKGVQVWAGLTWPRIVILAGFLEIGQLSGSINREEFIEQLSEH